MRVNNVIIHVCVLFSDSHALLKAKIVQSSGRATASAADLRRIWRSDSAAVWSPPARLHCGSQTKGLFHRNVCVHSTVNYLVADPKPDRSQWCSTIGRPLEASIFLRDMFASFKLYGIIRRRIPVLNITKRSS